MTALTKTFLYFIAVDGTSDDIDKPLKEIFLDSDFVATHGICSINSINWARVMVQIAHYFYAYFQVVFIYIKQNYHSST